MQKQLYIYGAGGMALVVADTAQLLGYEILGFVDDTPSAPVEVDGINVISSLPPPNNNFKVIIAIGDCDARFAIAKHLENEEYQFATLVHPAAIISRSAYIGNGVYIAAGAIIDPKVMIGNYSIINKNSIVSHGTTLGKACHLAPQSAVAANSSLGDAVWVGLGAKVIEKRQLSSRTFIGAGAVVIHDTNPNTLVYGIPAREMKTR